MIDKERERKMRPEELLVLHMALWAIGFALLAFVWDAYKEKRKRGKR
jgi:hypothetical protein